MDWILLHLSGAMCAGVKTYMVEHECAGLGCIAKVQFEKRNLNGMIVIHR